MEWQKRHRVRYYNRDKLSSKLSKRKTILGADDKAGMVILLYMIEKKIPGLYYFFIGEEVGCIGSNAFQCNGKNYKCSMILKR